MALESQRSRRSIKMISLLLLKVLLIFQICQVIRSSVSSDHPIGILNNRFGSCNLENTGMIHGQYLEANEDPNTWYYTNIGPLQDEEEEYKQLGLSYSKVNKGYVLGEVDGISEIERFLKPRKKSSLFPIDHPKQNKSLCYSLLQAALQPSPVHQPYRESDKMKGQMYLLRASHVLVRGSGIFGSGCGYYQAIEACETVMKRIGRIWWTKCSRQLKKKGMTFEDLYSQLSRNSSSGVVVSLKEAKRMCIYRNTSKDWQYVDKLFVISVGWDSNYGHFLIDSIPRVIRFLPFLQANPDVKIQIRLWEKFVNITIPVYYQKFSKTFRHGLFRLLNISSDRIVHGPIVARQLYYPRPMICSSALSHPYELRLLSKKLKESAFNSLANGKLAPQLNVTLNRGVYLPFIVQTDGQPSWKGSSSHRLVSPF